MSDSFILKLYRSWWDRCEAVIQAQGGTVGARNQYLMGVGLLSENPIKKIHLNHHRNHFTMEIVQSTPSK
jgi:hypothetical protein